jgi:hypothetical protein
MAPISGARTGDTMKALPALAAAVLAALSLEAGAVGDLADVTVVDRSTGQTLPVHWHDGRAYVVGKPGNEYQVIVRNRRGEDLLAVTSVDGVNVLTGQTASPEQSGYVVSPWSRVDIKGWRKSTSEVASFYFTSLPDSYAARTDRPHNVGVIGVALYRRAVRSQPEPEAAAPFEWGRRPERSDSGGLANEAPGALAKRYAPQAESRAPAPSAPLGTGHGRREESQVRYTEFDRSTREPVETIAIYYDSYRNLAARGVLRTYAGPRDPQPFPSGFAPDPWR